MAGDPLRDAFRALLETVKGEQSITWSTKDTLNTSENPDVSAPYLELTFDGGSEAQGTFGSPGSNLHDEVGQVSLNVYTALGSDRDLAEVYTRRLRNGFRGRLFTTADSRQVFIDAVSPPSGTPDGGLWVETILISYSTTNLG